MVVLLKYSIFAPLGLVGQNLLLRLINKFEAKVENSQVDKIREELGRLIKKTFCKKSSKQFKAIRKKNVEDPRSTFSGLRRNYG